MTPAVGECSRAGRREYHCVRCAEIGVVQEVEELAAELQLDAFRERGLLQHRQIHRGAPRTDQRVPADVAVGSFAGTTNAAGLKYRSGRPKSPAR